MNRKTIYLLFLAVLMIFTQASPRLGIPSNGNIKSNEDQIYLQRILQTQNQNQCGQNCLQCYNEKCEQCQAGYFSYSSSCVKCDRWCYTCEKPDQCSKCKTGLLLGNDQHCYPCQVLFCHKCQTINTCAQCKEGFNFIDGKCQPATQEIEQELQQKWDNFKENFERNYQNEDQQEKRRKVFLKNLQLIEVQRGNGYEVGVNNLSDRTFEQIHQMTSLQGEAPIASGNKVPLGNSSPPSTLDWNAQGKVTSVKDQGSCGSCWAFGTLAAAESFLIMKGQADASIDLSEQYLVECTERSSCEGTFYLDYAMKEILEGVPREETYPYDPFYDHYGICSTRSRVFAANANQSYFNLNQAEVIQLLYQHGPLAISISAAGWETYTSGIFRCNPWDPRNHAVLLVGYGEDYWLIKNQWGERWGDNGYMKISQNSLNDCHIGRQVYLFKDLPCSDAKCQTCFANDKCSSCKDANAQVSQGTCVCKDGGYMKDDGSCQPCLVENCYRCGNSQYTCDICLFGFTLSNGQCKIPSTQEVVVAESTGLSSGAMIGIITGSAVVGINYIYIVVFIGVAVGLICWKKNKAPKTKVPRAVPSSSNIKSKQYEDEGIQGMVETIFDSKDKNSSDKS